MPTDDVTTRDCSPAGVERLTCDAAIARARVIGGMGYLATPYTKMSDGSEDFGLDAGLNDAFIGTVQWYLTLTAARLGVVSPIMQSHVAAHADLHAQLDPLDGAFWQAVDAPLLAASSWIIVPPLPGRATSTGIAHEVEWMRDAGRPVLWVAV